MRYRAEKTSILAGYADCDLFSLLPAPGYRSHKGGLLHHLQRMKRSHEPIRVVWEAESPDPSNDLLLQLLEFLFNDELLTYPAPGSLDNTRQPNDKEDT